MVSESIILTAMAAREHLQTYVMEFQDELEWCSDSLCGACGAASIILAETFLELSYFDSVEVIEYSCMQGSHCFVLVDGKYVIDITASQFFSTQHTEVFVHEFDDNYRHYLYDELCDGGEFVYYGKNARALDVQERMIKEGWDCIETEDIQLIINMVLSADVCKAA